MFSRGSACRPVLLAPDEMLRPYPAVQFKDARQAFRDGGRRHRPAYRQPAEGRPNT